MKQRGCIFPCFLSTTPPTSRYCRCGFPMTGPLHDPPHPAFVCRNPKFLNSLLRVCWLCEVDSSIGPRRNRISEMKRSLRSGEPALRPRPTYFRKYATIWERSPHAEVSEGEHSCRGPQSSGMVFLCRLRLKSSETAFTKTLKLVSLCVFFNFLHVLSFVPGHFSTSYTS